MKKFNWLTESIFMLQSSNFVIFLIVHLKRGEENFLLTFQYSAYTTNTQPRDRILNIYIYFKCQVNGHFQ